LDPFRASFSTTDGRTTDGRFPWFALQVRSRRETLAAAHLQSQGYECFLPLYKSVRRWSDRLKELEQPLFPGYLFCRFNFHDRRPVLMTPGVQQIVGIGRAPIPVEERELEPIRQAIASGLSSQPWPYLQVGERVRVTYGSLSNLEGILIHFKGSHRVVLSLTLLQRSVGVEVDLAWVTPLSEARTAIASRFFHTAASVALRS
jgi:transcription antitermination factor NusG